MLHPFFVSRKSLIYYAIVWATIMVAHLFALHLYYNLPFPIASADAIIFNLFFAILSLPLWYVTRSVEPLKDRRTNLLINHITSIVMIVMIWILLSKITLNLIFAGNPNYLLFLETSIPIRIFNGIFYYLLTVLIYYLIIYYKDLQERLVTEARLKELVIQTELSLLKSQINPHFLFNSLNSISSLTLISPIKAQEMIIKLSDFLRYTITHQHNQIIPFEKEIELVKLYLDIEQIRFSDKLTLQWEIDSNSLNMKVPAMILQPIYENAIKHGVYNAVNKVVIKTTTSSDANFYKITISNNYEACPTHPKGAKLGLKNIKERLKLMYGTDQLLKIEEHECIFTVNIYIPINYIEK